MKMQNKKVKSAFLIFVSVILFFSFIPNPLKTYLKNDTFAKSADAQNYLIITTQDIQNSGVLNTFANFKKSLGFNVQITTVDYIEKNSTGIDRAEKIRNFLKSVYSSQNIKYLLLVGDPYNPSLQTSKSTGGEIPMRYCYPDPDNHTFKGNGDFQGEIPTDFYYADLTGDWDSDKDGYFGEYRQDNVDFQAEISVGRIPFNDPQTINKVLSNSINFEKLPKETKMKIILAAGIWSHKESNCDKIDSASLSESIWNDFLKGRGFQRTTLYEKEGIDPSTFNCDYPLNRENLTKLLLQNSYGISLISTGWGNANAIDRFVWPKDSNGDGFYESGEGKWIDLLLPEDINQFTSRNPSVYVVDSYCFSAPEFNEKSISKLILNANAAIFIGESRNVWSTCGWKNKDNGGIHSIFYYFIKEFTDNIPAGKSLYDSLYYYSQNFMWESWGSSTWVNMFSTATLYGDPSLYLFTQLPSLDDVPPQINNVTPQENSLTNKALNNISFNVNDNIGVDRVIVYKSLNEAKKMLISGLFSNVQKLSFNESPGPIQNIGEEFIPLVISSENSIPKNAILMAVTPFGKGYAFALGHDGFLSDSNLNLFDNKTFVKNLLSSFGNIPKKIIISTGHSEFLTNSNTSQFISLASSLGYTVSFYSNRISYNTLSNAGFLVIGAAWSDFTSEEIGYIVQFVENGGILLLGGLGWSWLGNNPSKTLDNYPMNVLGKQFGLFFGKDAITEPYNRSQNIPYFVTFYPNSYKGNFGPYQLVKRIASVPPDGHIQVNIELDEGKNNLEILAFDTSGNRALLITSIILDSTPPEIFIDNVPSSTRNSQITISGYVKDNISGISFLKLNNSFVNLGADNRFYINVSLKEGENSLVFYAEDKAGNNTVKYITVNFSQSIVIVLQVGNPAFTVNGETRYLDSPPIIKNGRTLVPIRAIVEALGGTVQWNPDEKRVDIILGSNHLILQVGNPNAYVNGVQKFIDASNNKVYPEIINGRTMLPLRFVAENLGCDVQWDSNTQTITITYGGGY